MSKLDEIEKAIERFDEIEKALYYEDDPPIRYANHYLKLLLPIARAAEVFTDYVQDKTLPAGWAQKIIDLEQAVFAFEKGSDETTAH